MTKPNGRYLIVNADDFGLSEGVNRGILRSHDEGIVTSTSLMVRQPAAPAAAEEARRRPKLSVGLHLDLGEWVYRDGAWATAYEVVPSGDVSGVVAELERQLDAFVQLVGRLPTHLDSHQHVHRGEPFRSAVQRLAARLRIPLRHFTPGITYRGDFYGQGGRGESLPELITPEALIRIIRSLAIGRTELGCHPGDNRNSSSYSDERIIEVSTLCDPRIRQVLDEEQITRTSF